MKKNYIRPGMDIVTLRTATSVLEVISADPTQYTDENFSRYRNRKIWDDEEDEDEDWY
jgi:hypothetical protein